MKTGSGRKHRQPKQPPLVKKIIHSKEITDLDAYVRQGSAGVYFIRAEGRALEELGIFEGDVLIVDREKKPKPGNIVVSQIGAEVLLHIHKETKPRIYLAAVEGQRVESGHEPIFIETENKYLVWATVTHIVRSVDTTSI